MKERMTSLDLRAEVGTLQALVGMRVANIYDLSPKCFIFKFQGGDRKVHLLLESGIRIHQTGFAREKPQAPAPFTSKLRKHLRTKRLDAISQLGIDRVVKMTFGTGLEVNHLIFELYASGNLILTDENHVILLLLRSHQFDETVKYAKNEPYPFEHAANLTFEASSVTAENVAERVSECLSDQKPLPLKTVLTRVCAYMHSQLADHCLREVGCTAPNKKVRLGEVDLDLLVRAGAVARELIAAVGQGPVPGFLTYKEVPSGKIYEDFTPVLLRANEGESMETFDTFDNALDQFFSLSEQAKDVDKQEKAESAIWKKKKNIEEDQARRIEALRKEQESSQHKARLIEENASQVEGVIKILTSCLETGVDWKSLWRMIKEEQSKGNPLAQIIVQLKLERNAVVVLLTDEDGESENVEIDITMGAFQNSREYYENKKQSVEKEKKTTEHMSQALKQADKKAKSEMLKQDLKLGTGVIRMRKVYWFEKFHWFISSQNFIVVSGNDAQQNEILVKRYMRKGDVYVHADVHGAASTIIKNPTGAPVPLVTLEEAGQMCICRSQAWTNKLITNAYWVQSDQVSKTAPTGMYLSTGSFMVRGKRNFLSPSKLEMGLVLLFKLGEESLSAHLGERRIRDDDESNSSVYSLSAAISVEEPPANEEAKEVPEEAEESRNHQEEAEGAKEEVEGEGGPEETEQKPQRKKDKKKKEPQKPKEEPVNPNKPLPRGKKSKLRKMKEKYGDQDEEERRVMLELLGSKEVKGFKPETVAEEPQKPEQPEEEAKSSSEDEEAKQEERKTEKQEIQQIMKDENLLEEELTKTLGELDTLTGQPLPTDMLLSCLPMCAPYSSLHHYKFRTKLLPGTQKRGKAIKMILYTWLSQPDVTPRERELIKQMSESEVITVLLSGVTVAVPGAQKIHKELSKKS